MADTDRSHVERLAAEDIEVHYIPEITVETLRGLVTSATDAIVSMLWDDLESCKACELAYEEFGIPRLIVRLNEMSNSKKLHDIGALVVVPSLAMVNLLDQFVRAPQTAALLMHVDPDHDTVQVTVAEPDIHGLALRDLRLPGDVLVLSIVRDGHSIMPHGYTSLHLDDEVTLVGKAESLEEMILKLGY
jgi:Trk K+ transport system NAD-binding subunit